MATVSGSDAVRPLTAADLDWALDLIEPRRQQLGEHAPHFWKPAPNARAVHGKFLGHQIEDPSITALRSEHGFVFAGPREDGFIVDDLMVDAEEVWLTAGASLIRAAVGDHAVRIVCPVHEHGRVAMAGSLGLTVTESWWTRDLDPAASVDRGATDVTSNGTSGRLVEAPPVYAPGGPVLIISTISTLEALAAVERQAEAAGAPVAVVPHKASDQERGWLLEQAGYRRTTDYYDGVPVT